MSRSTQFIGLTEEAQEFAGENFELYNSPDHYTHGMFGEKIPLGLYVPKDDNSIYLSAQEEYQTDIWSSGPMIYTKLVVHYRNGDVREFAWREKEWDGDSYTNPEFDEINGVIYV